MIENNPTQETADFLHLASKSVVFDKKNKELSIEDIRQSWQENHSALLNQLMILKGLAQKNQSSKRAKPLALNYLCDYLFSALTSPEKSDKVWLETLNKCIKGEIPERAGEFIRSHSLGTLIKDGEKLQSILNDLGEDNKTTGITNATASKLTGAFKHIKNNHLTIGAHKGKAPATKERSWRATMIFMIAAIRNEWRITESADNKLVAKRSAESLTKESTETRKVKAHQRFIQFSPTGKVLMEDLKKKRSTLEERAKKEKEKLQEIINESNNSEMAVKQIPLCQESIFSLEKKIQLIEDMILSHNTTIQDTLYKDIENEINKEKEVTLLDNTYHAIVQKKIASAHRMEKDIKQLTEQESTLKDMLNKISSTSQNDTNSIKNELVACKKEISIDIANINSQMSNIDALVNEFQEEKTFKGMAMLSRKIERAARCLELMHQHFSIYYDSFLKEINLKKTSADILAGLEQKLKQPLQEKEEAANKYIELTTLIPEEDNLDEIKKRLPADLLKTTSISIAPDEINGTLNDWFASLNGLETPEEKKALYEKIHVFIADKSEAYKQACEQSQAEIKAYYKQINLICDEFSKHIFRTVTDAIYRKRERGLLKLSVEKEGEGKKRLDQLTSILNLAQENPSIRKIYNILSALYLETHDSNQGKEIYIKDFRENIRYFSQSSSGISETLFEIELCHVCIKKITRELESVNTIKEKEKFLYLDRMLESWGNTNCRAFDKCIHGNLHNCMLECETILFEKYEFLKHAFLFEAQTVQAMAVLKDCLKETSGLLEEQLTKSQIIEIKKAQSKIQDIVQFIAQKKETSSHSLQELEQKIDSIVTCITNHIEHLSPKRGILETVKKILAKIVVFFTRQKTHVTLVKKKITMKLKEAKNIFSQTDDPTRLMQRPNLTTTMIPAQIPAASPTQSKPPLLNFFRHLHRRKAKVYYLSSPSPRVF